MQPYKSKERQRKKQRTKERKGNNAQKAKNRNARDERGKEKKERNGNKRTRNKKENAKVIEKKQPKTKTKNRAKDINKASRRAAQTNIFSAYFCRACFIPSRKESRRAAHKKRQKTPLPLSCAYYRKKSRVI